MISDITLLKDLTALSAVGGNPFDYFEDVGVKEVAVYGNDELLPIVWAYGFWSNVKIKSVYSDKEQDFKINVGERIRSPILHCQKAEDFKNNTPIVVLEKPSINFKSSLHIKTLISYSRKKRMLLDKVLHYKLENPDVRVLLLSLPALAYVKNKTQYEKQLFACSRNDIIEKDAVSVYLSQYIGDEGYGDLIFKDGVFGTKRESGIYFLADKNTKYVCVKDGHRVVPNSPEKYTHTIYTFGNSLCMGMYTDDAHTIQSQLQKRLNEYNQEIVYRVVNAANGGHPNFNKMWKSIEYHKPQAGDMIVLVEWFEPLLKENPNYSKYFEFCYPQQEIGLFDRPHNYGEYVWVDRVHLNCKSYTKLGDCLADKVIEIYDKENPGENIFDFSDSDVVFPDVAKLQRSNFWKVQDFRYPDYVEYVRKNILTPVKNKTVRWLNFKLKKPMLAGKNYKIIILMKYDEDVKFRFLLHGEGQIDYLPEKSVEADRWTAVEYRYTPSHECVHWLSVSATNFISAGTKLCIKKISITEDNS